MPPPAQPLAEPARPGRRPAIPRVRVPFCFRKRAGSDAERDGRDREVEIEETGDTASVRGIFVCSIKTDNSVMANFGGSHGKTRLKNKISSEAK